MSMELMSQKHRHKSNKQNPIINFLKIDNKTATARWTREDTKKCYLGLKKEANSR